MTATEFINTIEEPRRSIIKALRKSIIDNDKSVTEIVGKMMGKEMLLYNEKGVFKYALSSVKTHMSLHNMMIYGSPKMFNKFVEALPTAKFQKGCINFTKAEQMPPDIIANLIADCAAVDYAKFFRDAYNNNKR